MEFKVRLSELNSKGRYRLQSSSPQKHEYHHPKGEHVNGEPVVLAGNLLGSEIAGGTAEPTEWDLRQKSIINVRCEKCFP